MFEDRIFSTSFETNGKKISGETRILFKKHGLVVQVRTSISMANPENQNIEETLTTRYAITDKNLEYYMMCHSKEEAADLFVDCIARHQLDTQFLAEASSLVSTVSTKTGNQTKVVIGSDEYFLSDITEYPRYSILMYERENELVDGRIKESDGKGGK